MSRLLRIAVQVVAFFLLLGVVVGLASENTGVAEKVVLATFGLLVVWAVSVARTRLA